MRGKLGTNTYLIGSGPSRLLIDTGEGKPEWLACLRETLKSEACSVSVTCLTHWHGDHTGGVLDLLKLCPEAKIHKSIPESDSTEIPIADGEIFRMEGATVRAVAVPGHTSDHTCFVLEEENGAIFTGDAILGHGTAVFENLAEYMKGLEKLRDQERCAGRFERKKGYPGHGEVLEDVGERVEGYIKHRKMREDEVLAVLKSEETAANGGVTPMEIVKVVYKNFPRTLHGPAEGGVRQVLWKLESEGKTVEGDKEKWRLADRATL